jgi:RNA polymerase sigma factor (sigma-70 family)
MPQAQLGTVVRHLRRMASLGSVRELTDADLLVRFQKQQDEAAFAALMERHGRLVWSACWHVLHHEQDVEDAFQATFLVLARQARSIRHGETLASWLYRIAYRTALKARMDKTKRLARERKATSRPAAPSTSELAWRELQKVLMEELERLPDKYRMPFILCCLEGKSKSEAARDLGWKEGTVSGRLAVARKQMQDRLARRGMMWSAVLCAWAVTPEISEAALSRGLVTAAVDAALPFAADGTGAATLPSQVTDLARGVLRTMAITKLKSAGLLLLAFSLFLGAAGFIGRQALADKPSPATQDTGAKQASAPAADNEKKAMMRPAPPAAGAKSNRIAADARDQKVIKGRILDKDGQPLANAPVVVVADLKVADPGGSSLTWGGILVEPQVLGHGKTDGDGRYRVPVSQDLVKRALVIQVLATSAGHALGRQTIFVTAARGPLPARPAPKTPEPAETDLRLAPEEVLKGRLIDLDGQPAAGVKVTVVRVGKLLYPAGRQHTMNADSVDPAPIYYQDFERPNQKMEKTSAAVIEHAVQFGAPPQDLPFWPKPVITDAQGRFALHGLAKGQVLGVEVRDERYAAVVLDLEPPAQGDTAVLAVGPARNLEGTITDAMTGKPVPNVHIHIDSFPDYFGGFGIVGDPADEKGRRFGGNAYVSMGPLIHRSDFQADERGHYRINPFQGSSQIVTFSAGPQEPYLAVRKNVGWKDAAIHQELTIALPRGILVRGKVEEAPSGSAVSGCRLDFWSKDAPSSNAFDAANLPRIMFSRTARTSTDGSFQVVLPPGKWYLLANAPQENYLWQKVVVEDLTHTDPKNPKATPGKQEGDKHVFHPDGLVTVDLIPGPSKEVTITLHPSKVHGRLLGPDGKPVAKARMLYRRKSLDWRVPQMEVSDGRFQFPLADLETVFRVIFFDAEKGLGAAVDIAGKDLKKELLTVRMAPCGQARVRFVDSTSKPLANYRPLVWLLVPPNPAVYANQMMTIQANHLRGNGSVWLGHLDRGHYATGPVTDAEGYVTLPNLIAGASYQISQFPDMSINFTVESGKTATLADVVIKDPGTPVDLPRKP